ncbi:hypothetical protein KUV50_00530 [Membranicola marinus]|uniref:Uncharacterized protein n=1 Tax=Membranihabitans marinus TaxID=1227546 RepID=A0A953HRJ9_9BACT|nr:hypothetical protein [Membranihabitans marinus]MBY5956598.1 hypothetical protein [Membranihabitans marinus]
MSELLGIGSRVRHNMYGKGVVISVDADNYQVCFMENGITPIGKNYTGWDVIERIKPAQTVSYTALERSLERVLQNHDLLTADIELAHKWEGGSLIIRDADDSVKEKEIPIDTFFKKIIMVRERLRVMEQRINNSSLTEAEKINLQQYITRAYGSLTTFNVLFQNKDEQFVGSRSSKS